MSVCGNRSTPASNSDEAAPRTDDRLEHHQRADDAVAGRVPVEREQVARSFAAELPAAPQQLLENVAVADGRADELDAARTDRLLDGEVGHQRADDARHRSATGEPAGDQHVEQLVAVVEAPGAIDELQPVAVAVEGDAVVGAAGADRVDERLRRGRAEAVVDVEAVGTAADRGDLGAELVEDVGRDVVRRAVRGIDDDLQAAQRQLVAVGALAELDVAPAGVVETARAAELGGADPALLAVDARPRPRAPTRRGASRRAPKRT